jgi:hypothetical protein
MLLLLTSRFADHSIAIKAIGYLLPSILSDYCEHQNDTE